MITFITEIRNNEPDILTPCKHERLLVMSIEGQFLNSYEAPREGWTHETLVKLSKVFPDQWAVCGADATLGDQFVGSTEI